MSGEDAFEAEELERAAEWRMRKFDADPSDAVSRDAAALLEKLARDVRALRGAAVFREYVAICNWLGESDGIVDFMDMAKDYRARIGVDRNACRWGGVYTGADRAGEADFWGGVGGLLARPLHPLPQGEGEHCTHGARANPFPDRGRYEGWTISCTNASVVICLQ